MHNIIAERAQTTSRQRSRTYWLWDLLSHALDICCRTGPPAQEKSSTFPTVTMIHFVKYGISTSNYMGVHRGSQKLAPLCVPPFSVRSNPTCGGKFSRVHHDFHTCVAQPLLKMCTLMSAPVGYMWSLLDAN